MTRGTKAPAFVKLPELAAIDLNSSLIMHKLGNALDKKKNNGMGTEIRPGHVLALVLAFPSVQRIDEFVHNYISLSRYNDYVKITSLPKGARST